jgi:hypothetical protein
MFYEKQGLKRYLKLSLLRQKYIKNYQIHINFIENTTFVFKNDRSHKNTMIFIYSH